MYAKTIAILSVLCLAVPATASGDLDNCGSKYTAVNVGTEMIYYVQVTFAGSPVPWFVGYLENNKVEGLQRGGEDALGNVDPCNGPNPDMLLGVIF